jgi:hypothetical protein
VQSFEPGEDWIFCYVDQVVMMPRYRTRTLLAFRATLSPGGATAEPTS